jgi:peptide/nickel transport system substrate-binding protein
MMSGMYLNEAVIWLNDPSTMTNSTVASKAALSGVGNWARYSDPEVDELHFKFRNSSDVAARTAAYKKIQAKAAESAATINPVIMLGRTIVVNPRITNVTFSQDPYARYAYMRLK